MEWEGWMRDLERQGSVKQQHSAKSSHSPSSSEQLSGPPVSSPLPSPPLSDTSGPSPPHSPSAYPTIGNVIQNRDAFPGSSLEGRVPGKMKTTTVSVVSVGTASPPPRRRSSTLTPGSLSRLMKDRDEATARPSTAAHNGMRARGTHIRHAQSGSNLRLSPTEQPGSQGLRAHDAEGSSGGKKKVGLVRGMSMRAEKLVRGLDAAIDFVDNHY